MLTFNKSRLQNPQLGNQSGNPLAPALNPTSVSIDDRDHRDRLAFVAEYSKLILYYDKNNQQRGNWQSFFLKEPAILLAFISKTDYRIYHQEFIEIEGSLNRSKSAALETNCANQLCRLLQKLFAILNQWMYFTTLGSNTNNFHMFLQKKIEESLAGQLAILIASQSLQSGITRGQVVAPDRLFFDSFEPVWFNQQAGMAGLYTPDDPGSRLKPSLPKFLAQLSSMYLIVFDVFVQMIDSAHSAFKKPQTETTVFPDTALLMVFSRLMQKQQDQINQYGKKHLDFYYQQVLQQQLSSVQPDQAVVCLSLSPKVSTLSLPAGTAFKAGRYLDQSDILFCSQAAVEINHVALGEVLTLHYDMPSEKDAKKPKNLYLNSIANATRVQRNSLQEIISWSAFGDNQGLKIQQGFAFASPMLCLAAGQRTITLTLTFQDENQFQSIVPARYFSDCQCYLSTAAGWLPVVLVPNATTSADVPAITETEAGKEKEKKTEEKIEKEIKTEIKNKIKKEIDAILRIPTAAASSVTPLLENDENAALPVLVTNEKNTEIKKTSCTYSMIIQLDARDPAIIPFAPGKCPDGYTSRWPVLKIILGASADLSKPLHVCNVSIAVDVKEFDQFVLANDISSLSSKGVQLMLGSQPDIGSHFYVGSSECFSKPLCKLTLSLNWNNLPGDFSSYYALYNQYLRTLPVTTPSLGLPQFTNTSFTGSWSLLNQSSWTPVTPEDSSQNFLSLFKQSLPSTSSLPEIAAPMSGESSNTIKPAELPIISATPTVTSPVAIVTKLISAQIQTLISDIVDAVTLGTSNTDVNLPSSIFSFSVPSTLEPVPDLALNILPSITQARNGYLRFELTAPGYAFGHGMYVALVSYINLCNAQVLIGFAKGKDNLTQVLPLSSAQIRVKEIVDVLTKIDPALDVAEPLIDMVIVELLGLLEKSKLDMQNVVISKIKKIEDSFSKPSHGIGAIWSGITKLLSFENKKNSSGDAPAVVSASKSALANALQLMPNLPYSPRLESLKGSSYSALSNNALTSVRCSENNSYPLELYHYGSFVPYLAYDAMAPDIGKGFANLLPQKLNSAQTDAMPLFPGVSGDGCLYMALQGVSAPCTVNLYMEISTDSQQAMLDTDSVGYFYWSNTGNGGNTGWQPLIILKNGTNDLNSSGILQFNIPEVTVPLTSAQQKLTPDKKVQLKQSQSAQNDWTSPVMPTGDFWMAIATGSSDIKIKISYLNTQAVYLTRTTMSGLSAGETPKIDAKSIIATVNKIPQLANVIQPFSSYGGAAAETESSYSGSNSFYQRVSERLNHKDRASDCNDYVRMAYAACSELFYAKVLQGRNGSIKIGLVKGYEDATDPNAFRPSLGSCEKEEILKILGGKVSAMVTLSAFNMKHHVATINVNLIVDPQANQKTLSAQLNQRLKIFLSPWIQSDSPQVIISKGIQQAELANFFLSTPNVNGIASLSISLSLSSSADDDSYTLHNFPVYAKSHDAILVTALEHKISFASPVIKNKPIKPAPSKQKPTLTPSIAPVTPIISPKKEQQDNKDLIKPAPPSTPTVLDVKNKSEQMAMSDNGIKLLKKWEGCQLALYYDSAGKPTIGVGHCLTSTERKSFSIHIGNESVNVNSQLKKTLSEQEVDDLLRQDLAPAQNAINKNVSVSLNQNQFDALCSFTFNEGTGAFSRSTLFRFLNESKYDQVPIQLLLWDKDHANNVVPGLENRRKEEIALWNKPVTSNQGGKNAK